MQFGFKAKLSCRIARYLISFLVGVALIRTSPKHFGITCIITYLKLKNTVNHFTGKFIIPSNSQSNQLLCFEWYCRAAGGVEPSVSKEIMRLGT